MLDEGGTRRWRRSARVWFAVACNRTGSIHIENWAAKSIHSGRMAQCYQAAARLVDWQRPRPKGTGLGIVAGHFYL